MFKFARESKSELQSVAHSHTVIATKPNKTIKLIYRILEPRMVFDAALATTIADATTSDVTDTASTEQSLATTGSDAGLDAVADGSFAALVGVLDEMQGTSAPTSIVFIDSRVENPEAITGSHRHRQHPYRLARCRWRSAIGQRFADGGRSVGPRHGAGHDRWRAFCDR
ncbi:MAG: hypothetical protein ABL908_05860 [Hyphomicrobium sp.]